MTFNTFKTPLLAGFALTSLTVLPAFGAPTGIKVGDVLGTSSEQVRGALVARGFTVTEIEVEDGEIEAEIKQAGVSFELDIDKETGVVTEIEKDD